MKKLYFSVALILIVSAAFSQNYNLRINELIASNSAGQMDDFFETDDWMEIYNPPGGGITNLAGYYISDDPDSLDKWQIPATDAGVTTILPNNFKVLWMDDDAGQGQDHSDGIKLSSDGGVLFLVWSDGITIIDSVTYPAMAPDISYGRACDGCPDWIYFNNVTFEDNNFEFQDNDFLFINEVQTVNVTTHHDSQGEFDEWFEVYNPNNYQVNLANYYFSVNGDPLQWQVPANSPASTVIPPHGFRLIWCDNDAADGVRHSPLSLPTSGGTITITGPDAVTSIDAYTYGAIPEDQSYGRQNDGSATSIFFTVPTPTVTNALIFIDSPTLYINELLAKNSTDIVDNAGQHDDWFEIYNPNDFAVNMGGYYISDNREERTKWLVSTSFADSVTIAAHDWLLFWADSDPEQGVRHTNYNLSNNGEYLGLFTQDGFSIVDEIQWEHIDKDTSLGRITDGATEWVLFYGTTPDASNNSGDIVISVEESSLSAIGIYPNPANTLIFLPELMNIEVYSISGALIEKYKSVRSIDVSSWVSGMYVLRSDQGAIARLMKN